MEWTTIVPAVLGLLGLYLLVMFFVKPLRLIFKLIIYLVIGALLLTFVNLISSNFGVHIPLNPFTLITAGVLQVPGVILLLLMAYILL